jgi:hypothetical protein
MEWRSRFISNSLVVFMDVDRKINDQGWWLRVRFDVPNFNGMDVSM